VLTASIITADNTAHHSRRQPSSDGKRYPYKTKKLVVAITKYIENQGD
jgi:hypothetical protein